MPLNQDKIKKLYIGLKANNSDVGTLEEFTKWFAGNDHYAHRKQVFDAYKAANADVGKDYNEFMQLMYEKPKPSANKGAQARVQQANQQGKNAKAAQNNNNSQTLGFYNVTGVKVPESGNDLAISPENVRKFTNAAAGGRAFKTKVSKTVETKVGDQIAKGFERAPVNAVGVADNEPLFTAPHELEGVYEKAFPEAEDVFHMPERVKQNADSRYYHNLADQAAKDSYDLLKQTGILKDDEGHETSQEEWYDIIRDNGLHSTNYKNALLASAKEAGRDDIADALQQAITYNEAFQELPNSSGGYDEANLADRIGIANSKEILAAQNEITSYRMAQKMHDNAATKLSDITTYKDKLAELRKNDKSNKDDSEWATRQNQTHYDFLPVSDTEKFVRREYTMVHAAETAYKDINSQLDEAARHGQTNFFAGAGRGFAKGAIDMRTWDMGLGDLVNSKAVYDAVKKFDRGEKLTKGERILLDSKAAEAAANMYYQGYIGRGYKAGQVTAESLPFMLDMMINPLSATGSGASAMMTRYIVKRFGIRLAKKGVQEAVIKNVTQGGVKQLAKSIVKKELPKAARVQAAKTLAMKGAARVTGDIVGSFGMALTTGQARVLADATNRMTGSANFEITKDWDGNFTGIRYNGHEEPEEKSFLAAYSKGLTATAIENHSEMLGEYIPFVGSIFKKALGKMLSPLSPIKRLALKTKMGQAIADFIHYATHNDIAKVIKGIRKRAKFSGTIGEYTEEVLGNIENALLVGDMDFSTEEGKGVFNLSDNIDTFLGVALMSGSMSVVGAAGYRTPGYRAKKAVANAQKNGERVLGSHMWQGFADAFENATDENAKTRAVANALMNPNLKPNERKAIVDYVRARQYQEGVKAGLYAEEDNDEDDDVDFNSQRVGYSTGQNLATDSQRRTANYEYLQDKAKAEALVPDADQYDTYQFYEQVNPDATEEQKKAMKNFLLSKAVHDGMTDAMQTDIDDAHEQNKRHVQSVTNKADGNVTRVKVKGETGDFYVTSGKLVLTDNGSVDTAKSDEDFTVTDVNGKPRMIHVSDIVGNVDSRSASEVLDEFNKRADAEHQARVDAMNGKLSFTQGETFTIVNHEGEVQNVHIEQDAQTGALSAVIEEEGQAVPLTQDVMDSLQQMSDNYLQRQYEENEAAAEQEENATEGEEDGTQPSSGNTTPAPQSRTYDVGDEVSFTDEEGNESRGVIHEQNPDGTFTVEFEEPPSGRSAVDVYTPEELDALTQPQVAPTREATTGTNTESATEANAPTAPQSQTQTQPQGRALDRIPTDENGQHQFENAPLTDTANALLEMNNGDVEEAIATAQLMERKSQEKAERAKQHKDEGETVDEIQQNKAAYKTAQARADYWTNVVQSIKQKARFDERRRKIEGNLGTKFTLSSEKAKNGEVFYQNENGSTTLANIPQEVFEKLGISPMPFKLTESMGWHVYEHHKDETKFKNIDDAIKFVLDVVNNADHVRLGRENSYIFSLENGRREIGRRAVTIVLNSENGNFLGISTSGYERIKNLKERPLLWERSAEAVPEDAVTPTVTTIESQRDGEISSRTEGQNNGSSADKGTESSSPTQKKPSEKIADAEAQTETNPTEAQKQSGNYRKGHVRIGSYDISIEQPKGSVRRGTDANGHNWESEMNNTYGYIRGTEGVDGDHIDVFLSNDIDNWDGKQVFVVDQYNPDGTFDEHKVMLGYNSAEEAKRDYLANYEQGWENSRRIDVTPVAEDKFRQWVEGSHRKTKPFSEYAVARQSETNTDTQSQNQERETHAYPEQPLAERTRKACESVAKALGMDVEWVDHMEANGYFTETDDNGNPLARPLIRIARDAENPLSTVFGHESTHAVRSISKEAYQNLVGTARAVLGEKEWQRRFDKAKTLYEWQNLTDDKIAEEVVADAVGEMITNRDMVEQIAYRLDHPTLSALRDIARKMWEAVKRFVGKGTKLNEKEQSVKNFVDSIERAFQDARVVYAGESAAPTLKGMSIRFAENFNNYLPQAMPLGSGTLTGNASAPVRYSARQSVVGAGLTPHVGEDGKLTLRAGNKTFDANHHLTVDDLKRADSPLVKLVESCENEGTLKDADMVFRKYTDFLNRMLDKGDQGFEHLSEQWAWTGEALYKSVSNNSDAQYAKSVDITRVCKKNEAVINAICELQLKQRYGVTPGQVLDLYNASIEQGFQVPCPVCYVFSRYINNGQYASALIQGKELYGSKIKDVSKMTPAQRTNYVQGWLDELTAIKKWKIEHADEIAEAKRNLGTIMQAVDVLAEDITSGRLTGALRTNAEKRVRALSKLYQNSLDIVNYASLDGWITNFAIFKKASKKEEEAKDKVDEENAELSEEEELNKDAELTEEQKKKKAKEIKFDINEWFPREDTYREGGEIYPDSVALDLRRAAEASVEYSGIERFRHSRGAAAGKAIQLAADNALGETAELLGVANPENRDQNYSMLQKAYVEADPKKREKLLNDFQKRIHKSVVYAAQQTLRGGIRQWSWSDNIERLSPDVFLNLLQIHMLGGALQAYSKQLEGVELVASMGGYVNGSLMGKGIGYKEVGADYEGEKYYNKRNGKYYALEFDNVVGIEPFDHDGKHGLFYLNKKYDRAGNIIVGMDDIHVLASMADPRIFFIIPWHKSGMSNHILMQMYSYLGVPLEGLENARDYTDVQEEKKYNASDDVHKDVNKFWETHNYNDKFRCGIGTIENGQYVIDKDGKKHLRISEGQKHYRELRNALLTHNSYDVNDEFWSQHQDWLREIEADEFLSQVRMKVKSVNDLGETMTTNDTKYVYPYEYWDMQSTYDTADVNGQRYLEYCRRMGFQPKFVGIAKGKFTDYGNFAEEPGYWKLLIDRRMYDTKGRFQDLTPVTVDGFTPDLCDPEKTGERFNVTTVADETKTKDIVERAMEMERERGYAKTDRTRSRQFVPKPKYDTSSTTTSRATAREKVVERYKKAAVADGRVLADAKRIIEDNAKKNWEKAKAKKGTSAEEVARLKDEYTQAKKEREKAENAVNKRLSLRSGVTPAERALRDAVVDRMKASGIGIIADTAYGQKIMDMANGRDVRLNAKQKRALETVSVSQNEEHPQTAVSSAAGANILNSLDNLVREYKDSSNTKEKTFIGKVAEALGINKVSNKKNQRPNNGKSRYATFETMNGKVVTIRLSNHNAKVSNFDNNEEIEGISIVVSPKENTGVVNDGNAHIVEYFYDALKLRRAEGKPLADIVRSIKQALYSGEFKDTTGLAERQEVNADAIREHRIESAFDSKALGKLEGRGTLQSEVTDVTDLPKDMAYRETDINELTDILDEGIMREMPYEKTVEGIDTSDSVSRRGFVFNFGREHGRSHGVKAFAKGAPWTFVSNGGSTSSGTAQQVIIGFPGKVTQWRTGYHGRYTPPKNFDEIEHGKALAIRFDEDGYIAELPVEQMKVWVYDNEGKLHEFTPYTEDAKITDHVRYFRTEGGEAYGFTVGGKIYIDPRIADTETPVHEYTHLWATALRANNTKEWANVVNLMKGEKELWEEIRKRYPELKTDDELADEVLAHYSGKRGAERLREEQRKIAHGEGTIFEKAQAISALERVRQAIKKFWEQVADFLHIHYTSAEQVADQAMKDLLEGVDPTKFATDNKVREQFIGEKGAKNLDTTDESTVRMDNKSVAEEMESAGKDAKAIKMATGWERGVDGKWRYEVQDLELKDPAEWIGKRALKLGDIVTGENAEQLFAAYPDLKSVKIKKGQGKSGGSFDNKANSIELKMGYYKLMAQYDKTQVGDAVKHLNKTLVHEIQHFIQYQEGFAKGGNPNTIIDAEANNRYDYLADMLDEVVDEYNGMSQSEKNSARGLELKERYNTLRGELRDIDRKHRLGDIGYHRLAGETEARNVSGRMGMTDEERRSSLASETEDVLRKAQIIYYGNGNVSSREEMLSMQRSVDEERRELAARYSERKSLVTSGSYFSGGGLLEEGLKGIINPKVAVEFNEKIAGVYADNHGNHIVTADVRNVDPRELVSHIDGEVQYFHASPVCKNFSTAKHDAGEVGLDMETAQSTADFISEIRPKVVTIENVKGYRGSESLDIILDTLRENGYDYDVDVYNTADYGGYTKRERLIVRAVRDGKLPPKPTKLAEEFRPKGWMEAVEDLMDTLPEKKSGVPTWMDTRLKGEGIDWRHIDKPLYVFGQGNNAHSVPHAFADELLPTLRTKGGDVIIMPDGRVLRATPRVLARVTGLSDDYRMPHTDDMAHTIVGNGIPTQLSGNVIAPLLQSVFDESGDAEKANNSGERYSVRKNNNVELSDQEYAELAHAIDSHPNKHKGKEGSVSSEFTANNFYAFEYNKYNDYNVVLKLPIDGNEEQINFITNGIEEGSIRSARDINSAVEGSRIGQNLDNSYTSYAEGRREGTERPPHLSARHEADRRGNNEQVGDGIYRSSSRVESADEEQGVENNRYSLRQHNRQPGQIDMRAANLYEQMLSGRWSQIDEAWHDDLVSVRRLQEALEQTTGRKVRDYENVYLNAVHKSSKNKVMMDRLVFDLVDPMIDAVKAITSKHMFDQDEVEQYLNCKHGLERNQVLAQRKADEAMANDEKRFVNLVAKYFAEQNFTPTNDHFKDAARAVAEQCAAQGMDAAQTHTQAVSAASAYVQSNAADYLSKARGRDYSGLTGIFDPEGKHSYSVADLEDLARNYVNNFENEVGKQDIDELWKRIHALNNYSLHQSYRSGLISKEQYDDTRKMYQWYVPLRGFDETTADDIYDYLSHGEPRTQQVMREAKGRTSRAANILATMVNMGGSAIMHGNNNQVKQKLLNLALNYDNPLFSVSKAYYIQNPSTGYWEIAQRMPNESWDDYKARMEQEAQNGTAVEMKDGLGIPLRTMQWQADEHAVHVKRNGQEYIVYINGNPRAAQAINGLLRGEPTKPGVVEKSLQKTMSWLSKSVTSLNPEFVISNFERDLSSAVTVSRGKYGAGYAGAFMANVGRISPISASVSKKTKWTGIYNLFTKWKDGTLDMNNETEKYFKEFMENGGETGFTTTLTVDDYQAQIERRLADTKSIRQHAADGFNAIEQFVDTANRGVENICRFAAYMTSRQRGESILTSVQDAKEVSTNFNLHGSGALGNSAIRKIALFVNPAMQSVWQYAELTAKHPARMLRMAGATAMLGAGLAVLMATVGPLFASGGGDGDDGDDGDEGFDYWHITPFTRRNYIIIPTPWNGKYVKYNLAPEIRAIYGLGVIAAEAAMGHCKHENVAGAMLNQLSQLIPVSFFEPQKLLDVNGDPAWKSIAKAFTPAYVNPLAEAYLWNEDFMGRPISRDDKSYTNGSKPQFKLASDDTFKPFVEVSRFFNRITGGTDYTKGFIDFNPSKVAHLGKSYLGGIYTFVEKVIKTGYWMAEGMPEGELDSRDVPILNRFLTTTDSDYSRFLQTNTDFNFYKGEYESTKNAVKGYEKEMERGDTKNADEYNALLASDEYKRYLLIEDSGITTDLKKLGEELKEANSAEEQKAKTKEIYQTRQRLVKAINKADEEGLLDKYAEENLTKQIAKETDPDKRLLLQAKRNMRRAEIRVQLGLMPKANYDRLKDAYSGIGLAD